MQSSFNANQPYPLDNLLDASFHILRIKQVLAKTGHGRSTLYNLLSQDKFPKPVAIGSRAVGWRSTDIDAYLLSLTEKGGK